jgi:hypothetical protein
VWQLLSHGVVLGTTGPELPQPKPDVRSWPLVPTPSFARVQPLVAAMADLQSHPPPLPDAIRALADTDERARAVRSWIATNREMQRTLEVFGQLTALALQLVGDDQRPLAARSIVIAEVPPPGTTFVEAMRKDFAAAGFVGDPPYYLVVASLESPLPSAPASR